ncbi:type II toxin-antitoxin system Phd/YefM family antitoxin [Ghiorsea bivora]|uniref:type II toxin-antitoxin system Phd/YefM family antitoxin n=1 Tax=Ghiorsea bivora TaxID=1485545 RepID=UPI00056F3468|nr:type II toxin-antitoxin system Phd/YefM family antitoxin [Ghiorsea bivora]
MTSWQLQDAKARLSEVIKSAVQEGPQEVTVRGKPSAVILSVEAYQAMKKQRPDFVSFMQQSPLQGEDMDLQRSESLTRDISL